VYEVDFLQVATSEKSGDAIALRFTRPDNGKLAVVVIDAGYAEFGDTLADHIRQYYGTSAVDLVISTHPDSDHFNGLTRLLERVTAGELMVHRPDRHGYDTDEVCAAKVSELVRLARAKGITVTEPFYGLERFGGAITILGPTQDYYEELLEEQVAEVSKAARLAEGWAAIAKAMRKPLRMAADLIPFPVPFSDDGGTSARNNTSAVVQVLAEGGARRLLFTGDAGVPALSHVIDAIVQRGEADIPLSVIQVSHHGSRHNASSELLDRLLGSAQRGLDAVTTAMVSASADDPKHPSAKIVNEYKLRRCRIISTETGNTYSFLGTDRRPGWSPAAELPYMVDEE
jgi:beta-lactamase superfamily II metal-dependent hydrolase